MLTDVIFKNNIAKRQRKGKITTKSIFLTLILYLWNITNYKCYKIKKSTFKIPKIYKTKLQRYRDWKIKVSFSYLSSVSLSIYSKQELNHPIANKRTKCEEEKKLNYEWKMILTFSFYISKLWNLFILWLQVVKVVFRTVHFTCWRNMYCMYNVH